MRFLRNLLVAFVAVAVATVAAFAAATYPTSVRSFPLRSTGEIIQASWFNDPYDEITAVENGLLNGTQHDLKPLATATRLLGTDSLRWKQVLLDLGTLTTDGTPIGVPAIDMKGTWNNAAVTFTGIRENITDTASAAASLLLDLQKAGTSQFKVDKSGNVTALGNLTASGNMVLATGGTINAHIVPNVAADTFALLAATQTLSNKSFSDFVKIGTNPASAGLLRLANSASGVLQRNNANGADVTLVSLDGTASDIVNVGVGKSVTLGLSAPATSATSGFPYAPAVAGTPTGTPSSITGYAPYVVDTSNNVFYFYSGAWRATSFPFTNAQTSTVDVTNTATETDLYNVSIPQNTLTAGRHLRLTFWGDFLQNAGLTVTIRIKFGATTIFASAASGITASASRQVFSIDMDTFAIASNSQVHKMLQWEDWQGGATGFVGVGSTHLDSIALIRAGYALNTSTEDNGAGAVTLKITAQWSGASVSASARALGVKVVVYP